jgi:diguanylate cyclase
MPRSEATAQNRRPPRLVVRFAILTALGLALAAITIAVLVRTESTALGQRYAIERARFAADAVLERELRSTDLSSRPTPARRRELRHIFEETVLREGIRGVALYAEDGRLTYSSGVVPPRRLPQTKMREALKGVAVSWLSRSGRGGDRVLWTSVPVVVGPEETAGVALLEQDYSPIEAAGRRAAWLVAAVLEGLLILLVLLLAPVLVRVTARIRDQIAQIEHVATHDEHTGTANRIRLRRAVENALASSAPGALLLVDIDGFSELNGIFGSDGGDAVLREVALRLRWELADCELVARLGEDEFGVLLDSASPDAIDAVADRIKTSLEAPVLVEGVRVVLTVSLGAAALGDPSDDFVSLLRRASTALAIAKDAGDGEVCVHEPGNDVLDASRAALLAELRRALEDDELRVHFQPQVDLATRQVRAVEALLRWEHPTRGLLTAGEFVHEAERSGLARELRRFVLESAAQSWRTWKELGLALEVSVNIGPVDLVDASLPSEVASVLEAYGIPPWNLVLEITERTLVADERRTDEVIGALGKLGVRLAVDDFGAGYSSLASLQRFPVQIVKLDRSLLANALDRPAAGAILRGSVELAHAIGATVVAEGVEHPVQLELVQRLGCDIVQGYLVGRPVPPDEVPLLWDAAPPVTEVAAA